MTDHNAKMAAHWNRIIQGRLGAAPDAERAFVDGVLNELGEMVPRKLPKRPAGVPECGPLEYAAKNSARGGSWLNDFLAWRTEVERVEAHNASNVEAVFGAARAAAKLGDAHAVRRCVQFTIEVYGYTGREMPPTALEAKRIARELTQHHDVIGIRARSVLWEQPALAAPQRAGMRMGGRDANG